MSVSKNDKKIKDQKCRWWRKSNRSSFKIIIIAHLTHILSLGYLLKRGLNQNLCLNPPHWLSQRIERRSIDDAEMLAALIHIISQASFAWFNLPYIHTYIHPLYIINHHHQRSFLSVCLTHTQSMLMCGKDTHQKKREEREAHAVNFRYVPLFSYLPTYLPAYIHTYINTYIHTYIHT